MDRKRGVIRLGLVGPAMPYRNRDVRLGLVGLLLASMTNKTES